MSLYKFGPEDDLRLVFDDQPEQAYGAYFELGKTTQLLLQLVSHAVLQIRQGEEKPHNWTEGWRLDYRDEDYYITYEKDELGQIRPVRVNISMIYPVFDLSSEGCLLFSLREEDDRYVVEYLDLGRLDAVLDAFFDSALEHANRFGRNR